MPEKRTLICAFPPFCKEVYGDALEEGDACVPGLKARIGPETRFDVQRREAANCGGSPHSGCDDITRTTMPSDNCPCLPATVFSPYESETYIFEERQGLELFHRGFPNAEGLFAAKASGPAKPLDNTDFHMTWRKEMTRSYLAGALRKLRGDDPATLGPLAARAQFSREYSRFSGARGRRTSTGYAKSNSL